MEQYLELAKKIIKNGQLKKDRTETGTYSIFGTQTRYRLDDGFPLITTKKMFLKGIIHELLWFLKGDTNIKYLVMNGVNIWNEWPYKKYKESDEFKNESLLDFIEKIRTDDEFAAKHGELGPIYSKQWRNFGGVDQIHETMKLLKNNPDSRRIIISAWNPAELSEMLLPPCHSFFQFYVINNKISCQLYQRSADYFLGVPFNIASYSLLTLMIAHVLDFEVGEFIHTIGDCHIYLDHLESITEQIKRKPFKKPKILFARKIESIFDFKYEDFILSDYIHHPTIKGKVSI